MSSQSPNAGPHSTEVAPARSLFPLHRIVLLALLAVGICALVYDQWVRKEYKAAFDRLNAAIPTDEQLDATNEVPESPTTAKVAEILGRAPSSTETTKMNRKIETFTWQGAVYKYNIFVVYEGAQEPHMIAMASNKDDLPSEPVQPEIDPNLPPTPGALTAGGGGGGGGGPPAGGGGFGVGALSPAAESDEDDGEPERPAMEDEAESEEDSTEESATQTPSETPEAGAPEGAAAGTTPTEDSPAEDTPAEPTTPPTDAPSETPPSETPPPETPPSETPPSETPPSETPPSETPGEGGETP